MDHRLWKLAGPWLPSTTPIIIGGHRGDRARAPENTVAAFRQAIDLHAPSIEFDIHLTADNQIVVIHDDDIARCSNGAGRVREMTLAELRRFDFGSWFHPDFAGEPIPTLEEALAVMKGKTIPVVEIKKDKRDYSPAIEERLLGALREAGMTERSILISFDGAVLERLHATNPNLLLGALGRNDPALLPQWLAGWHPPIDEITPERVAVAHARGFWALPWNANDIPTMRRMMALGVDIVCTDYLELFTDLLSPLAP